MCKNALILVVTALLCLTSFSAEPIKVSNTNGNATNPRIAVMQTTSDIHIVWQEEGDLQQSPCFWAGCVWPDTQGIVCKKRGENPP